MDICMQHLQRKGSLVLCQMSIFHHPDLRTFPVRLPLLACRRLRLGRSAELRFSTDHSLQCSSSSSSSYVFELLRNSSFLSAASTTNPPRHTLNGHLIFSSLHCIVSKDTSTLVRSAPLPALGEVGLNSPSPSPSGAEH